MLGTVIPESWMQNLIWAGLGRLDIQVFWGNALAITASVNAVISHIVEPLGAPA